MWGDARTKALRQFERLAPQYAALSVEAELMVEFGKPGEMILHTAKLWRRMPSSMGLHYSSHAEAASHIPWATAYHVVGAASCSVLTVRN